MSTNGKFMDVITNYLLVALLIDTSSEFIHNSYKTITCATKEQLLNIIHIHIAYRERTIDNRTEHMKQNNRHGDTSRHVDTWHSEGTRYIR